MKKTAIVALIWVVMFSLQTQGSDGKSNLDNLGFTFGMDNRFSKDADYTFIAELYHEAIDLY